MGKIENLNILTATMIMLPKRCYKWGIEISPNQYTATTILEQPEQMSGGTADHVQNASTQTTVPLQ